MKTKRNPNGYWNSIESVERELLAFIKERGIRDRMPTDKELLDAGQTALRHAITKHGGHEVFAKRLGLKHLRRKRGLWNEFPALEQEIRAFVKEHGNMGMMPSAKELRCAKRTDLVRGIAQYGGYPVVASKLGLGYTYSAKPKGYWKDFENVKKEVLAYMKENDTFAKMPTAAELLESGQASLGWAINYHGGYQTVAERLGLKYTQKRQGYWKDVTNIERAVLEFVEKHGTPGQMPSLDELKKVGYGDLSRAISKHGGYTQIANRLKLSPAWKFKPMYYWKNSANLEREILDFVNQHGTLSVMPTEDELESAHRRDLVNAITKHGGFTLIALGLGLIQKRMTPLRAKDVEHTARAIQPLAESNLLSGAQVMVILRRAGLLEYRNPRVLRLSASLARGNHDEIESAISNLVSSGEEIVTETVTVAESDNLTQSEIEALTREGFDTNAPGVQLNVPAIPDTQREQAIIRGLSNLGELRLPLDDILGLLTSKILWQEFYKRLYAWYGSLAAAQTVTAEDVNAAILAAYPEHTANEFVAEASALFTFEVEQAVNFAASLSDSGWCGPRLRLHQADAARRMADVLIGSEHSERSAERESKQAESKDATRQNTFLLNADDPGMGKSASFLAAVAASGVQSVIIVAPKTVADDTWMSARGEIKRCLPHARIVRGIDETLKTDPDTRLAFFVLHYEELLNEDKVAMLAQKSFDCLCLDEIHFIKQRATQVEPTHRRSALELLRASAQTAIGLTGTPLINELAEPMSLLQTLSQHAPQFDHARLSSRRMSDVADVFEAMLPHIIRRRKDETLLHLPGCDVRPVSIPLPLDLEARMIEIYKWQRSRASEALVQLRKLATDAKLAYLVERARAARKMLILTYLTDDISEKIAVYLNEFFPCQVAHINGQTPRADRQKYINSFRNADGARVLVGTIGTIGTGLTLFDPKSADTANEIIFADLPYTYAEFDQGAARLYREGQKQRVRVDVLQTTTSATLRDGSALDTLDERIWELIEGKRELSDIAIDGKYDTTDAASKVQKPLRRWLKQAREVGVEPLAVERRPPETSDAQKWRSEIARLRGMSAAKVDEVFADAEFTREFLAHLKTSTAAKLSHEWVRGKLALLMRPDLAIVDMGCGLNPFADLPCKVIGLDRHDLPGVLRGKMENPNLPDKSADVLIYSLSLYGTASDLFSYFTHAARILRGGGHLFIVEPDSTFTSEGTMRFVNGLRQFGFELVGSVKDLRGEDGTPLKGMHLTLTSELVKPTVELFERK